MFQESDQLLEQFRYVVVCPSCLGEKHISQTVDLEHEGAVVRLCRCPHCAQSFRRYPERVLQRHAL